MRITLRDFHLRLAARVASRLHDGLRAKGYRDAHGMTGGSLNRGLEAHAAAAELAASLLLGLPWSAGVRDDPLGPDVGRKTQVRSSVKARDSHHLIVRRRDLQKYGDVPFVLVVGDGRSFRLAGWLMASEAPRVGREWDGGNGRPPAWFVHEGRLRPAHTFREPA